MSTVTGESTTAVEQLRKDLGINIEADLKRFGAVIVPRLMLYENGEATEHVTTDDSDYESTQLGYYDELDRLIASRMIVSMDQGKRTELAYWTRSAPPMELTVHQGIGQLKVGLTDADARKLSAAHILEDPKDDKPPTNTFGMRGYHIDHKTRPTITLNPGSFYTLEALIWTPKPFVVSALYSELDTLDWLNMEVPLEPGQTSVLAPDEGDVEIPEAFIEEFASYLRPSATDGTID